MSLYRAFTDRRHDTRLEVDLSAGDLEEAKPSPCQPLLFRKSVLPTDHTETHNASRRFPMVSLKASAGALLKPNISRAFFFLITKCLLMLSSVSALQAEVKTLEGRGFTYRPFFVFVKFASPRCITVQSIALLAIINVVLKADRVI